MRMEANLQVSQEMRMKLAPQVIQSIEILQLPLMELEQRIDTELQENPLLERAETQDQEAEAGEPEEQQNADDSEELDEDTTIDDPDEAEQFERLEDLTEYYEKHNYSESGSGRNVNTEKGAKQEALENSPCPDPTLEEYLHSQLSYFALEEPLATICENIISNLDDRGFLECSLDEISKSIDIQASDEHILESLNTVQSLEPPGVGARDLKESLLLQLDPREKDHEFVSRLILDHFDDITKNRLPKIANEAGCSLERLKEAIDKIGSLNPRPGSLFANPVSPHVIPDVIIQENEGRYEVIIENSWLPSLRISAYYVRRLQEEDLDDKTREYLKRKLQAAQGIVSAIEQRRATLENVTEEIVRVQKDFFRKGEMHLKPLKMQDVADKVGVHVSTVSRAIADKYAQTPQGVYSLKRFFTGGTRKKDGDVESWDVVRQKLLHIVDNEDKNKPLSDDAIAEKLKGEGIDIARRTVAKYRKNLNIPSSRMRKKY